MFFGFGLRAGGSMVVSVRFVRWVMVWVGIGWLVSVGLYVCGTCCELHVVSDDLLDLFLVGGFAGLAFLFSDLWGVDLSGGVWVRVCILCT